MADRHQDSLSAGALRKVVVSKAGQSPLTVYPLAAAALTGVYIAVFGAAPWLVLLAAGAGTVGVTGALVEYFARGGRHAQKYLDAIREDLARRRAEDLRGLATQLAELEQPEAVRQLEQFQNKFESFVAVLKGKLNPGELTFERYLATAEQVYLAGLDNLKDLAVGLRSVQSIDEHHLIERIENLQRTAPDSEELEPLAERLALKQNERRRAQTLLQENERAMTQLDLVSNQLANTPIEQRAAALAMEAAMSELRQLASRTERYAKT